MTTTTAMTAHDEENKTSDPPHQAKKNPTKGVRKATEDIFVTRPMEIVKKPVDMARRQIENINLIHPPRMNFLVSEKKVKIPTLHMPFVKKANKNETTGKAAEHSEHEWEPVLPPDDTLKTMEPVLQTNLFGVSMDKFYDECWSTSRFYQSYMESQEDKHDVVVSQWETTSNITGDWDNEENFTHKRVVQYQYDRDPGTMGYSLGKPVVRVSQTQFIRMEGVDRAVIAITVEMNGEVMSDSFAVHIRGVATRLRHSSDPNKTAMKLDFGVFCRFTRQVLLAKQIRAVTNDATKIMLHELIGRIKDACGAHEGSSGDGMAMSSHDGPVPKSSRDHSCIPLGLFDYCKRGGNEAAPSDDIELTQMDIVRRLHDIAQLKRRKRTDLDEQIKGASEDMTKALEALSRIHCRAGKGADSASYSSTHAFSSEPEMGSQLMVHLARLPFRFFDKVAKKRVVPDKILSRMNIIVVQKTSSTPRDFFNLFTQEGESFLKSFYADVGFENVVVGPVERSPDGKPFFEPWSEEVFTTRRSVSCTLHASAGKIQNHVLQNFRLEKDSKKFVFEGRGWTSGEWFSDLVDIKTRWVVDAIGEGSLAKIGLYVSMVKHSTSKETILAGIYRAMTSHQLALMEAVLTQIDHKFVRHKELTGGEDGCAAHIDINTARLMDKLRGRQTCVFPWRQREDLFVVPGSLLACDEELFDKYHLIRSSLRHVDTILKKQRQKHSESIHFSLMQLVIVSESLESILQWQHSSFQSRMEKRARLDLFGERLKTK